MSFAQSITVLQTDLSRYGILNGINDVVAVPNQFLPIVTDCAASFEEIGHQLRNYTSTFKNGRTFLFNVLYNLGPIVTSVRHLAYVLYYPEYTRVKTWRDFGMEAGQIFYLIFNPAKSTIASTLARGDSFPIIQNHHTYIV